MNKKVYPVVLTQTGDKKIPYSVYVPDFPIYTQGMSLENAIYMAEDAISLMGVSNLEDNTPIPEPSDIGDIKVSSGEIKTLVAVDFEAYAHKISQKAVKKTLSIPSWLNVKAEAEGINFSQVLQEALKEKLHIA